MSDTIYTETDQAALDFTHEVLTDINNFLCRADGRPADLDLEKMNSLIELLGEGGDFAKQLNDDTSEELS